MAMTEFGPEVSEGQEAEKKEDSIDSDFEGELDGKYDEYLNGKSKEELMQMRSEARNYQREELIKMRDELLKMKEGDDSEDDTDPQKVLKRTLHR